MKIGWIGTGVMGSSMCGHLLAGGFPVTVYSRTKSKAQPLLDQGATWADSPCELAGQSDVIFTMVGFPEDVRQVYFATTGILAGIKSGTITVDMTTTSPSLAREIHAANPNALDAPVTGGDVGARNATLSIMVGGDKAVLETVLPLLQRLGKTIIHHGPAGAGQDAKLANQIVIAGTMIGVCEALFYAHRAGLDCAAVLQSIRGGAAGCWTLENLAPRILNGNFEPGFFVDHFVKDMGLALEECRRIKVNLPGLQLVHDLYRRMQSLGYGRKGTQALYLALEEMAKKE